MLDLLTVKTTSPTTGPQSSMGVSQTESILLCGRMGGLGPPILVIHRGLRNTRYQIVMHCGRSAVMSRLSMEYGNKVQTQKNVEL